MLLRTIPASLILCSRPIGISVGALASYPGTQTIGIIDANSNHAWGRSRLHQRHDYLHALAVTSALLPEGSHLWGAFLGIDSSPRCVPAEAAGTHLFVPLQQPFGARPGKGAGHIFSGTAGSDCPAGGGTRGRKSWPLLFLHEPEIIIFCLPGMV